MHPIYRLFFPSINYMTKNRWYSNPTNRRILTFACLALVTACCGFAVSANAAMLTNQVSATGDILTGSTDLVWTASTNGINCPLPLPAGAEQVQGSYSENYISQKGSYDAVTTVNNLEIIRQETARKVSMSDGTYREGTVYYAVGQSANPSIICGNYIAPVATEADTAAATATNSSTPVSTAYCEVISSLNQFSGPLNYQSQANIVSLDITPDTFGIKAISSGDGWGSMGISGYSNAGLTNTTTLGYHNEFHQTTNGFENYQIGENFQWSSFKNTFDFPEITG
jgi:hypothetical protein